jgi:UDP:flavonoid glycosyltransferase YjiC (YdhE family)
VSVSRVLFTFAGGSGHFLPLVPLARAARGAGHAVAFAGQAGMVATVEAAGFTAFDTRGATLLDPGERRPLLPLDPDREARAVRDGYAGRTARDRAPAVIDLCRRWRPDVVVSDEMDFGAVVAAERLGLPHATVLCIASGSMTPPGLVAEPLDRLRADHGLPPDPDLEMLRRHLVLSPFPRSLRDPAFPLPATAHLLRPEPVDVPEARPPAWLTALPREAAVYFTLGTIFNLESGDLFQRVLAGLRELPLNVVVTVGREVDPRELGPQPAHVHVERYVPQWSLLPHCRLVVSHGGSGSVVGALAHGLPMVLVPMGADQPLNAARCVELGVALAFDPIQVTPDSVREAAATVLADPRYRRNAERLRDEIAAMPPPSHAVALLERLCRAGGVTGS